MRRPCEQERWFSASSSNWRCSRGVAALAVELTRGAAPWVGWPLAVGAVLAVAALWGALLSPKAPIRLPAPAKLLIELALFAGVALGLAISGHWLPAAAGLGLWAADRAVLAATAR